MNFGKENLRLPQQVFFFDYYGFIFANKKRAVLKQDLAVLKHGCGVLKHGGGVRRHGEVMY